MSLTDFIQEDATLAARGAPTKGAGGGTSRAPLGDPVPCKVKVAQVRAEERTVQDDQAVTEWLVHLLPTTLTPTATSVVHARDRDLEIIGEPELMGDDSLGRYWRFHATSKVRG